MERLDQHRSKVLLKITGDLEASRGAYMALLLSRLRIPALFATCFRRTISCGTWRETAATRNWDEGRRVRLSTVRFCGNKSQTKQMCCVVTLQYDHCVSTCAVFVAEAPAFRSAKNLSRGGGDGKRGPKAVRQNERTKARGESGARTMLRMERRFSGARWRNKLKFKG